MGILDLLKTGGVGLVTADQLAQKQPEAPNRSARWRVIQEERVARRRERAMADLGIEERTFRGEPVFVKETRTPVGGADGQRGTGYRLAELASDGRLLSKAFGDAFFFDVESTGLSHGAGTFAFLIGIGWLEGSDFVVEQLFSPEPAHEPAMLGYFKERLAERSFLVSYNGKSYDSHILQNRLILTRVVTPKEESLTRLPHVDLLNLSRWVFRYGLKSFHLADIERHVLGLERVDDIPGSLIPGVYFRFLMDGDGAMLDKVVEHNLIDVTSMFHILSYIVAMAASPRRIADPGELYGLGLLQHKRKRHAAARYLLTRALEAGLVEPHRTTAIKRLTAALAKDPHYHAAAVALEKIVAAAPERPEPVIALAKLLEHQLKEPSRALAACLGFIGRREVAEDVAADMAKRIQRLKRKAGSAGKRRR